MSIKFYGKSQEVVEGVIARFQSGDLPQTLANVFVERSDNIPSASWSYMNRFIMAIHGTQDARGFRQWQDAGRKVSKGTKAFHILGPCMVKRELETETGERETASILIGFKSIPVFALESTEVVDAEKWETCSGIDQQEESRLGLLPFRSVADAWGLNVTSYNGKGQGYAGYYSHAGSIALGVKNLATWAHELTHAADHRNKTLTVKPGQQWDNEIVAEVGGATLMLIAGETEQADIGGAWEYVLRYSKGDREKAINNCMKLINRICQCIALVLETASQAEPLRIAA